MARPIDADKTIGLLKTRLYETALNNATAVCGASYLYTECADNRIDAWINEVPTMDAEPVRHGHWVHLGGDEWCCDKCGFVISTEGSWQHPKETGHDYCMHCGAKMKEVDNAKTS